jgi:ABC-2 type transport system permease protein
MADEMLRTGRLVHFMLRRGRVGVAVWLIALVSITLAVAAAFPSLFPGGQAERLVMLETLTSPAMVSMLGPAYGADNYTYGAMMAHEMLLFTALTVAIMSILITAGNTRREEERGRVEVIRSLPVGRLANMAAALVVGFVVNAALAVLVGLGLYALGMESIDLHGSMLYGAALGVTGVFFTAVTALFAQLSETGRGTLGYSFTFLVLSYLVRAVGDVSNETVSRISPLGLILRAQVYVNNYWWPVLLMLAATVAVSAVALYLNSIRDLGAGLIPARPGPQRAKRSLLSPIGLALRLQRTTIIGWAIGIFVLGAYYGSVFGDLESFIETSDLIQRMVSLAPGFSFTEQFSAVVMAVMSMISAVPAIMMVLKLAGEEKVNHTEHILARAVPRQSLMGGYLLTAIAVALAAQLLAALGLWSAAASVMEEPLVLGTTVLAAMTYSPAILIMVGLAALLVGWLPKGISLTWLYLGYSFMVIYIGRILQIPDWIPRVTPFGHVPLIPVEKASPAGAAALLAIAAVLMYAGLRGYEQRDIHG